MPTLAQPSDIARMLAELRQRRDLVSPERVQQRRPGALSTGMAGLDALLGGGVPAGRLLHLVASPSAAATSVAMGLAERQTALGHTVAWVDRAGCVDALTLHHAGVDLTRLLWCQPADARRAWQAVDALLGEGGTPLVIADLGGDRRARLPDAAWVRLSRRAEASNACLTLLALADVGAGPFAAATLQPSGFRARFEGTGPGRTFEGAEVVLSMVKNKLGLMPGQVTVLLRALPLFPGLPALEGA